MPSLDAMKGYAARRQIRLTDEELERAAPRVEALLDVLSQLEELSDATPSTKYPCRDPGHRPTPGEDPYNAVVRFCGVSGAPAGPLSGVRIGVKDNISIAGVPTTGGNATSPEFTPTEDSLVVERLLDCGASVTATTNVGASFGLVRNPVAPTLSAGGSSSGSAAAVAGGLVDAALGADQGGSVRIPAAWCGLVGMKATRGLVPNHGLDIWEGTLDHIGPMTPSVELNSVMLECMCGRAPRDRATAAAARRTGDAWARGLRIGMIEESLKPSGSTPATVSAFERAGEALEAAGARLVPMSVPLWTSAFPIWLSTVAAGLPSMRDGFGTGHGQIARIDPARATAAVTGQERGDCDLPFEGVHLPFVFDHLRGEGLGAAVAHAQNLRCELTRQIDAQLARVDLLITPTTPEPPRPLDHPASIDTPIGERYRLMMNTCPLNLSGHPALTVPFASGFNASPFGVQIVGRPFDEDRMYRAAFGLEAA
jgi:amidase